MEHFIHDFKKHTALNPEASEHWNLNGKSAGTWMDGPASRQHSGCNPIKSDYPYFTNWSLC